MAAKKTAKKKTTSKKPAKAAPGPRDKVHAKLRTICLKLPEVVEAPSFGNPAFRVGKYPFVVLDRYKGVDCIFLYVDPGLRDELLQTQHFFKAPYDPKEKALCRTLEKIDWVEMKALIVASHRLVSG